MASVGSQSWRSEVLVTIYVYFIVLFLLSRSVEYCHFFRMISGSSSKLLKVAALR